MKSDDNEVIFLVWYTDFISSIVYAMTSFIEIFPEDLEVLSFIMICSPSIKTPVVWDNAISSKPVDPALRAAYPIAPLLTPLILDPSGTSASIKAEHLKIVNVWTSYRCKSNSVESPEYAALDAP